MILKNVSKTKKKCNSSCTVFELEYDNQYIREPSKLLLESLKMTKQYDKNLSYPRNTIRIVFKIEVPKWSSVFESEERRQLSERGIYRKHIDLLRRVFDNISRYVQHDGVSVTPSLGVEIWSVFSAIRYVSRAPFAYR